MKRLTFITLCISVLFFSTESLSQDDTNCTKKGYKFAYLSLQRDDQGNIKYEANGHPVIGVKCVDKPSSSDSDILKAPMPLNICIGNFVWDKIEEKIVSTGERMNCNDSRKTSEDAKEAANSVVNKINQLCGDEKLVLGVGSGMNCLSDPNAARSVLVQPHNIWNHSFWTKDDDPDHGYEVPALSIGGFFDQNGDHVARAIIFNATDNFLINNKLLEGKKYCYSRNCSKYLDDNYYCLDLERILFHEIGHQLGLAHVDKCNTGSEYPEVLSSEIMYSKYDKLNYDIRDMTCYMACALKMLYCPSEGNGIIAVTSQWCPDVTITHTINTPAPYSPVIHAVYPSPSSGIVNIVIESGYDEAIMDIYNINGIILLSKRIEQTNINRTVNINQALEPGMYYIVLKNRYGFASKKAIINK